MAIELLSATFYIAGILAAGAGLLGLFVNASAESWVRGLVWLVGGAAASLPCFATGAFLLLCIDVAENVERIANK